jgi:predicted ATPase/DNA-binding SARP family transcriptional activator
LAAVIEIGLLGRVVVEADGGPVILHGLLEEALLARLALEPGRTVSSGRLIGDLWGEKVGLDPTSNLWTLVHRLRRALGADGGLVRRASGGYALTLPPDHVDVGRFEMIVGQVHDRSAPLTVDQGRSLLRQAFGLWRGKPLAGLENLPFHRAQEARLAAAHLALAVELVDAEIAAGKHAEVVSELEGLVAEYPFEERLWAQLMTALYRCGSQTAALRTGSKLRTMLADELGIGPSPMVQALEAAILAQDPKLDWSPTSEPTPLSLAAAAAVRPERASDFGAQGVNDLGRPEPRSQHQTGGLPVGFPGLWSPDRAEPANNLPQYLSTFVGRPAELAEIRSLVNSSRLVTLTGAGGSGKTRLALEVARRLLDTSNRGVFFVDLAPIAEADQVPGALAAAMGARQKAGRSLTELLVEVLADQDLLIILDNCEHLVDACAKLADRLNRSCPQVHLLATSREPLGIDGERVYRVPPLSLPSAGAASLDEIRGSDAVELFFERARAHDPTFALDGSTAGLVTSICRKLDGMPFAIELAAARSASMSLSYLNDRLDQRLRLLTEGARTALPRQRTLRATVDWSFDLLSGPEQAVLLRLSVFSGGFELEAAEALWATGSPAVPEVAELLGSLVNKSLVVAERSSGSLRYRLLETIRQYAAERFLAAEGDVAARQVRNDHAQFYLGLAETAAPELMGRRQGEWFKRLDLEWDNIRAALGFLFAEPDRTEELLRLGVALQRFYGSRGHLEAIATLRGALERPDPVPTSLRARALCFTGHVVSYTLGIDSRLEMRTARQLCQKGLEMAREIDDAKLVAEALYALAWTAHMQGEADQAALLGQEALQVARAVGDPRLVGLALSCLAREEAAPARRRTLWLEALACLRQAGDIYYSLPQLWGLAALELDTGRLDVARALYQEAIVAGQEIAAPVDLGDWWGSLGWVLLLQGELEEAALLARKSLIACRRVGRRGGAASAIFKLACCATGLGNYPLAAKLTGALDALAGHINDVVPDKAYKWSALEQRMQDDNRKRLHRALGGPEFERAYIEGSGLSVDEAADLALGRTR